MKIGLPQNFGYIYVMKSYTWFLGSQHLNTSAKLLPAPIVDLWSERYLPFFKKLIKNQLSNFKFVLLRISCIFCKIWTIFIISFSFWNYEKKSEDRSCWTSNSKISEKCANSEISSVFLKSSHSFREITRKSHDECTNKIFSFYFYDLKKNIWCYQKKWTNEVLKWASRTNVISLWSN